MAAELRHEQARSAIRAMREEDVARVIEILRDAPEAVSWPEAAFKEALRSEGGLELVSETRGKTTGFLIGRRAVEEAEILNLAVAAESRRSGEGAALLKAALESFFSRGVSRVFLEVRESNQGAITFYRKYGFAGTGRREGYYRDPPEAALTMERKLTAQHSFSEVVD